MLPTEAVDCVLCTGWSLQVVVGVVLVEVDVQLPGIDACSWEAGVMVVWCMVGW
jgi:hypothetical protein